MKEVKVASHQREAKSRDRVFVSAQQRLSIPFLFLVYTYYKLL